MKPSQTGGLWKRSQGAVGFSSQSGDWETPQAFFDKLNKGFGFTLDPCASAGNAKCALYYTEDDDGLQQDWGGHHIFVNPPYGRRMGAWVQKAYSESRKHNTVVVMLIPARTDTKWWHDYVMKAKEVHLVRGRLKFGSSASAAPFPSAVVVFHSDTMLKSAAAPVPNVYSMERT